MSHINDHPPAALQSAQRLLPGILRTCLNSALSLSVLVSAVMGNDFLSNLVSEIGFYEIG